MKDTFLHHTANQLGDRVTDISDKVSEFVTDNTTAARERLEDVYDDARRKVGAQMRTTRRAVRKHPVEAVLISLGVGLVLGVLSGLLMHRRP